MADPDALEILRTGTEAWNQWRTQNPSSSRDLRGVQLQGANLAGVDFSGCDLSGRSDLNETNLRGANLKSAVLEGAFIGAADLRGALLGYAAARNAYLMRADLSNASLKFADLQGASLQESLLTNADLRNANLFRADLENCDARSANLTGANLTYARLVNMDITKADLTGCRIYAAFAWGLKLSDETRQRDLIITGGNEPEITVDNIEVAQFIYALLHDRKIRDVIDTITSKVVLILGRFTDERKAVLDALRDELRKRDYAPILFDFDKPMSRSTDETITLLARMARFVIADISDAKSILQELRGIVPDLPSVPIQPVIIASQEEPGMFDSYRHFPWFLPVHRYDTPAQLITELGDRVIKPSEAKVLELRTDR